MVLIPGSPVVRVTVVTMYTEVTVDIGRVIHLVTIGLGGGGRVGSGTLFHDRMVRYLVEVGVGGALSEDDDQTVWLIVGIGAGGMLPQFVGSMMC